jgi:hypothetical protein
MDQESNAEAVYGVRSAPTLTMQPLPDTHLPEHYAENLAGVSVFVDVRLRLACG